MSKIILAVVGLAGSGKTEASQYILGQSQWGHVHFGNTVVDEVKARGLEVCEANERIVREELRERHGMAAMAVLNLPRIRSLFEENSVLIESFYSWEEYIALKHEFGERFKVLAIYANFEIRAARLANRPVRPLTREQLDSRDYAQIDRLHQAGPIARADFMIINEGTTEELYKKIDAAIAQL